MKSHEHYMKQALALAEEGLGRVWPNPSVGCVIVKGDAVVGVGRTQDGGRPHAEEFVLSEIDATGATAYVTLEPCHHDRVPMSCTQNLIRAGVSRVVVGCGDPDPRTAGQGIAALRAAGIDVVSGVCEAEAQRLNEGFFLKMQKNRPFICLKQAISADGMIATRDAHGAGQRTQISGDVAHHYLHELRATMDAVAVGVNTVIVDDPLLTVRLEGAERSIVRVVFDSDLRIPRDGQLVQTAGHDPLWVLHKGAGRDVPGARLIETGGCVRSAVQALAEAGITRLLVEGGAALHHSFVQAGLADEVQIIRSSKTLGEGGVKGADFEALGFEIKEERDLGEDRLEIYRKKQPSFDPF